MKHIYEINTAVWLNRLSAAHHTEITLANVPDEEIQRIARLDMDTVWLMGVWQRSPDAERINANDEGLVAELTDLLPDFTASDIIGSAYAVQSYQVDERFGGSDGLKTVREQLARHGMKLLLDFVPNHTAFDHVWTSQYPERYITAEEPSTQTNTHRFRDYRGRYIAHGQDPTLSPWSDVAQVNAFSDSYRHASIETLRYIATIADGARCDMAMLMINDIFASSWGKLAGPMPETEYWTGVIEAVRVQSPHFIFVAEGYWDTEQTLVELGFDYVYDKTTYDYLVEHNRNGADYHLATIQPIAHHLLHFLENHDEPRSSTLFSLDEELANAAFIKSLPGACLWHDGQFEGYRKHVPVHLGRGPIEPVNQELLGGYQKILAAS